MLHDPARLEMTHQLVQWLDRKNPSYILVYEAHSKKGSDIRLEFHNVPEGLTREMARRIISAVESTLEEAL